MSCLPTNHILLKQKTNFNSLVDFDKNIKRNWNKINMSRSKWRKTMCSPCAARAPYLLFHMNTCSKNSTIMVKQFILSITRKGVPHLLWNCGQRRQWKIWSNNTTWLITDPAATWNKTVYLSLTTLLVTYPILTYPYLTLVSTNGATSWSAYIKRLFKPQSSFCFDEGVMLERLYNATVARF